LGLLKRTIYPLILPAILVLLAVIAVAKWPDLLLLKHQFKEFKALLEILPVLPYGVLLISFVMGWRYHNAGLILASLALAMSYFGLTFITFSELPPESVPENKVPQAVIFLLPLNLAFYSVLVKRRIHTSIGVMASFLFIAQVLFTLFVCHPHGELPTKVINQLKVATPFIISELSSSTLQINGFFSYNSFLMKNSTIPSNAAFVSAFAFILYRFLSSRNIQIGGFLLVLIASFIAAANQTSPPALIIYFTAAGLVLISTTVEASYSMAYLDELTGLPGRRSLDESLLNLGKQFTIAMIDVDHFKRFNDTHGHKVGDQVLRLIAARLGKMSGGAKAFRYGGEEFTAIFAGKDIVEVRGHIDAFRKAVASNPFVIRSQDRRAGNSRKRRKTKSAGVKKVKVTVSIGMASPNKNLTDPEEVLKAADKALYKAKRNGRNRVER
jgi:diguanylate cyclase (GGDEF)-like protein